MFDTGTKIIDSVTYCQSHAELAEIGTQLIQNNALIMANDRKIESLTTLVEELQTDNAPDESILSVMMQMGEVGSEETE